MDDGFGHWMAGFIDGEGCFIIARNTDKRRKGAAYVRYACRMQVRLREDDADVVMEMRDRTGLGTVAFLQAHPSQWDRKPQVVWNVISRADCLALVDLLDRYPLRAKKARDYAIWREAVSLWAVVTPSGGPSTGADWEPLADLFGQLKAVRAYREVHRHEVA